MEPKVDFLSSCPRCGYDRNASTALRCEVCDQTLHGPLSRLRPLARKPPPIFWIGLGALLALGGGLYLWNGRGGQQSPTATAPWELTRNDSPAPAVVGALPTMAMVESVPAGLFNYGGSTTFAPLRSRTAVETIAQAHPDFHLRYIEPVNSKPSSGWGIKKLLDGELSFSQSSRPLKESEYRVARARGFRISQIPVAIDGVAFYVNPGLKLPGLSTAQLRGIFTGQITNWRQVGGPDLPIVPVSRALQTSDTVDFIYENLLNRQSFGKNVRTVQISTEGIRQVARTPGSIGYATASEVVGQGTIAPVALKKDGAGYFIRPLVGKRVNASALRDGNYPLTQQLYVIRRHDGGLDELAGAAYANLLLSDEGQKLIEASGFVPIH